MTLPIFHLPALFFGLFLNVLNFIVYLEKKTTRKKPFDDLSGSHI